MGIKKSNPNKNFMNRNLTIYLNQSQVNDMRKFPEVNWSIVARVAFKKYCADRKGKRYTDTEEFVLAEDNKIESELNEEKSGEDDD